MTFTLFQISALITVFVSLFFGVSVYSRGRKSKLNFFWFLTSLSISAWSLGLFGVVFSTKKINAWIWQHVLDIGAILIPVFYFNFVLCLIRKEKEYLKTKIFVWIIGVILLILSFTNLFKWDVSPKFNLNYWIDPGKLYFLFPLTFVLLVIFATIFILREYRRTTDEVFKRQLQYLLLAQVFGFGGGVTNFFPQLFHIYPFGNYLVILYVIFISLAALRHHLFDIRLIATELLTFAIWIFLLIKTALSESLQDFIVNISLLVTIVFLGALLVRSVWREVRQREKMEVLTKKVQRAYEVEKRARKELNKLDEVKNQFIMASQHHLRTPLTSMRGYLELLLEGQYGKISPQVKEVLRRFNLSSERLIKIVNEFLDITQFQLGKEVIMPQPGVDLEPIFKEIVEELGMETKARGLYLRVNKPKRLPKIKADSEKLKIALFNIVDNAIKYTRKGGITINIKKTDSKVQITVKDTGVGIPKEQQKGLFNKLFVRGKEATKLHGTGRGIGLYIAYHIIKAHNGKIWVESEGEGKGTIFFIELPIS